MSEKETSKVGNHLSLRSFARMCGVSVTTVSRVINGESCVKEKTRKKVLSLAQEVNFRPNPVARAAFGGKTDSIGVILGQVDCTYWGNIFRGIQNTLYLHGFIPILADLTESTQEAADIAIRRMIDHRVDGLIMNLHNERIGHEHLAEIVRPGIPIVTVDMYRPAFPWDGVMCDDTGGGRQVARHLLELGHPDVAVISYGEDVSIGNKRMAGFLAELGEKGIHPPASRCLSLNPFDERRDEMLRKDIAALLTTSSPPTAIFCTMDGLALEVYEVAGKLGLSIPQDLSVVGFADLNYTPYIFPPLTTVHQDGMAVGHLAAERILARLQNQNTPQQIEEVPVQLIVRKSTAPPK